MLNTKACLAVLGLPLWCRMVTAWIQFHIAAAGTVPKLLFSAGRWWQRWRQGDCLGSAADAFVCVLFLVGGFVWGKELFGVVPMQSDDLVVGILELLSFLLGDGMKVGLSDLQNAWRLPGRALLVGLPLTLIVTAVLAHYIVDLPRLECFLLGAVLAPMDLVCAGALGGDKDSRSARGARATCSTSSRASTSGLPCPSSWSCWPRCEPVPGGILGRDCCGDRPGRRFELSSSNAASW